MISLIKVLVQILDFNPRTKYEPKDQNGNLRNSSVLMNEIGKSSLKLFEC